MTATVTLPTTADVQAAAKAVKDTIASHNTALATMHALITNLPQSQVVTTTPSTAALLAAVTLAVNDLRAAQSAYANAYLEHGKNSGKFQELFVAANNAVLRVSSDLDAVKAAVKAL